jgi:hypothetical protein
MTESSLFASTDATQTQDADVCMVVCPKSMMKMKLCPGQCFLGKFFLVPVLFFLATCHALQL